MRGRPGCPTGQEKNSVGATGGSPLFSTRKGWVQGRPLIRPSVRTGAPSPQGEGFGLGCVPFRLQHPPLPARPAGGRAVTGVRYRAAGQAKKEGGPSQGPPNQKRWVQGGRTSSSLVFFPPAFFQRKPGSPAGVGGVPRGAAPQGWLPRYPPKGYAAPSCPRQVVRFGPSQVRTCDVVPRPVPGGGSRLSLEKARTQRVAGEGPRPPFFDGPLARFGGCGTLFRWWGYYEPHVRTLIWNAFFG